MTLGDKRLLIATAQSQISDNIGDNISQIGNLIKQAEQKGADYPSFEFDPIAVLKAAGVTPVFS